MNPHYAVSTKHGFAHDWERYDFNPLHFLQRKVGLEGVFGVEAGVEADVEADVEAADVQSGAGASENVSMSSRIP